jgi:pyridoxamine 5'-phosphate oxidase family protein
MALTQAETDYLASQPLGRLATVAADGSPQVNPVSYRYRAEQGVIDIGGHDMGASRKFRNVARGGRAALVVDDIVSFEPWRVRFVEIRGTAEVLTDEEPYLPGFSREVIRIHPRRVLTWGLDPDTPGLQARDVT